MVHRRWKALGRTFPPSKSGGFYGPGGQDAFARRLEPYSHADPRSKPLRPTTITIEAKDFMDLRP